MSVKVTLNCKVKHQQFELLLPFLDRNLPNVRGFKGCMGVNVLFDQSNHEMLLDEKWQSVEDHQQYLEFINNNGVLGQLSEFLDEAPAIKYFAEVDV